MTLRTDSIYGHSEPFGRYTYCRTFCFYSNRVGRCFVW